MTCIAGLVDRDTGEMVLGGDAGSYNGWDRSVLRHSKVSRCMVPGVAPDPPLPMLLGYSGSARVADVLRYRFTPPQHALGLTSDAYIATSVVDTLRETFRAAGCMKEGAKADEHEGTILLAYNVRLFRIDGGFAVTEREEPYNAIGCGEDFALGALRALHSILWGDDLRDDTVAYSLEERVRIALGAAVRFSGGVSYPLSVERVGPCEG